MELFVARTASAVPSASTTATQDNSGNYGAGAPLHFTMLQECPENSAALEITSSNTGGKGRLHRHKPYLSNFWASAASFEFLDHTASRSAGYLMGPTGLEPMTSCV